MADYVEVMQRIGEENLAVDETPNKDRLQTLDKHYSAILDHAPNDEKPKIRDHTGIQKLRKYVSSRCKATAAALFEEKVNPTIERFKYPELYQKSEEYLWNEYQGGLDWPKLASSLRNRFTLLSTVQTVCRHESTVKCKLSEFQVLNTYQMEGELAPYPILFRNINIGKVNQGNTNIIIQAKSIRHKDPKLCEQGALAIYLFTRFYVTNEDFDLSDKAAWFNVHTAVPIGDVRRKRTEAQFDKARKKPMTPSAFYEKLADVFWYYQYKVAHVLHFGRSCAPVLLEFAGVLTTVIKELGNWDLKVYDKHYSLSMAWEALRAAAGFNKETCHYHLPRSKILVPTTLRRKVFPNVERARVAFDLLPQAQKYHLTTARQFLEVMDHLANVFIQDICALRHDGRHNHSLYRHPLFLDPEFVQYEAEFSELYPRLNHPDNDPTLDPVKKYLPNIGNHLVQLKVSAMRQEDVLCGLTQGLTRVAQMQNSMQFQIEQWNAASSHIYRVMDAAAHAHICHTRQPSQNSPSPIPSPRMEPCVGVQVGVVHQKADLPCTGIPVPPQAPTTAIAANGPCAGYPQVDSLKYDSLEKMYSDWRGEPGTPFYSFGGIKAIYSKKEFRLAIDKESPNAAATKKMLQHLRRNCTYIDSECSCGKALSDVFADIRSHVKEETVTSVDNYLAKKRKASTST